MKTFNKVVLFGNVVSEPDVKVLEGGVTLLKFGVATDRVGVEGKADFHNIVAWRGLADLGAKFLSKGMTVLVSGSLITDVYLNKDGKKVKSVQVQAEDISFVKSSKKVNKIEIVEAVTVN